MIPRYSTKKMNSIWSDQFRFRKWIQIELIVCKYLAKEGIIPKTALDNIVTILSPYKTGSKPVNTKRISSLEKLTKHDVVAFINYLEELLGRNGRWIHLGLTSSDLIDTTISIQLAESGKIIKHCLSDVSKNLFQLAKQNKGVLTIGRTHGMHAEPISLGKIFKNYCWDFESIYMAFDNLSSVSFPKGKLSGAVGNHAYYITPKLEYKILRKLNLYPCDSATQVIPRHYHAQYINYLALLGAQIERLCTTIRHWQKTEVGEISEGFAEGQKGSSAMPHKRNPIGSENLTGIARILKGYSSIVIDNVALWHERDISHSSTERVILADACHLTHYALKRLKHILQNLIVNKGKIKENLTQSNYLFFSQKILLALVAEGKTRSEAYRLVQTCAFKTIELNDDFRNIVKQDKNITSILTNSQIQKAFNLDSYRRF